MKLRMKVTPTAIPDVLILEPKVFCDDRGFLLESYNKTAFLEATGVNAEFVQDNHSRSYRGVLRGLHYQLPPNAQGKLVRVVQGDVWEVAVDIRRSSPTFSKWVGQHLSASQHRQMWIPPGFAHGFFVCSEFADFLYKTTSVYSPESERCILWNDPSLDIDWPLCSLNLCADELIISEKDKAGKKIADADVFEKF